MLDKLVDHIKNYTRSYEAPNPEQFKDPVASEIDWSPLKKGGSSFRTHKIAETGSHRIELVPTTGSRAFPLIFIMIGAGIVGMNLFYLLRSGLDAFGSLFTVLFGFIFFGAGIWMHRYFNKKKTFDKSAGYYWEGKKNPRDVFDTSKEAGFMELRQIHALQIIRERVKSDKSSFWSYELNLVLTDKTRMNVVDHGNLPKLREDAQLISKYLEVPIWDGTNG